MYAFGYKINLLKIFIAAVVIFVMMATPSLRRIVWYILPLGSGYDDIVGALALIVIAVVAITRGWISFAPKGSLNRKKRE